MIISVYYDDTFTFTCDMKPEVTNACLRRVTPEEHTEIERLLKEYAKLQALLKDVQDRPEIEFDEAWTEFEAARY